MRFRYSVQAMTAAQGRDAVLLAGDALAMRKPGDVHAETTRTARS
jgi:hypothetical protein